MTRNDTRIIHTDGLEEGIRCAMCTNPMANNRGCDGGCDINESMYKRVLDVIKKNILEQEQKTGHYEKHIDHTDCIWYGSYSGCPVTCSQYRDGWNDAMDYIFKNGKGYQPYRRNG